MVDQGIQVSMDGKGRYLDNIFVERLWRSVKHEGVYLESYQNGTEARKGIGAYLNFYNGERPQQALGYLTPGQMFKEAHQAEGLQDQAAELLCGIDTLPQPAEQSLRTPNKLN